MIINIQNSWLIHKYWSGETSAYLILFTEQFGLIKALYKGARKKGALLQAFHPLWISVTQRRDFNYVNKLELSGAPLVLPKNNLFAALYINELIYHFLKLNDPHVGLYNIYHEVLYSLSDAASAKDIEKILRYFEAQLLINCGYYLSFTTEAKTFTEIVSENYYKFIPGEGFIISESGIPGYHLIAIANNKLEDEKVLALAKKIMRLAIEHILDGKEIVTRRLYSSKFHLFSN